MTSLEEILTQVSNKSQLATAFYMTGKMTKEQKDKAIAVAIENAYMEFNMNDEELRGEAEII